MSLLFVFSTLLYCIFLNFSIYYHFQFYYVVSLDGAATEGLKALCVCLSRQIDYQKQLKPNMEALEIRMRELIAKNDDIMRRVECAKLQGGSASNEVTNWLQEVEFMKRKVSDTQRTFKNKKIVVKDFFQITTGVGRFARSHRY